MRLPKPAIIYRFMLLIALTTLIITALDLLNILPGASTKLTPILLALIILFLVYNSRQQRRSHRLLLKMSRTSNKQSSHPASKPNKKRQPNSQPEYRSIAWHGLTLRSQSEVKIAKALDNKGVLFLADPKIRLNTETHRQTREVDFLIQHQGKWGILEVDGPHHQHSAEADHWRDARLIDHGLLVLRFPADQCYRQPDLVVETFLQKLIS